jgi:hypothetical protein
MNSRKRFEFCAPRVRPLYMVDLPGGLGNQIFAYFAAQYLSSNSNSRVVLQFSTTSKFHVGNRFDLSSFSLKIGRSSTGLFQTIFSPLYFPEKNGFNRRVSKFIQYETVIRFDPGEDTKEHFDSFLKNVTPSLVPKRISGYFGDFAFHDSLSKSERLLVLQKPSTAYQSLRDNFSKRKVLGIHIRAGDYLGLKNQNGILGDSYYREALDQVFAQSPDALPIIFSNDQTYAEMRVSKWKLRESFFVSSELLPDPAESPKTWRRDLQGKISNIPIEWQLLESSWAE